MERLTCCATLGQGKRQSQGDPSARSLQGAAAGDLRLQLVHGGLELHWQAGRREATQSLQHRKQALSLNTMCLPRDRPRCGGAERRATAHKTQ